MKVFLLLITMGNIHGKSEEDSGTFPGITRVTDNIDYGKMFPFILPYPSGEFPNHYGNAKLLWTKLQSLSDNIFWSYNDYEKMVYCGCKLNIEKLAPISHLISKPDEYSHSRIYEKDFEEALSILE